MCDSYAPPPAPGAVQSALAALRRALALAYGVEFNTHRAAVNGWAAMALADDLDLDPNAPPALALSTGGWAILGAGHFSMCLASAALPEGFVLKVSLLAQDAGPQYWRYCMDHLGEEFVPVVSAMGHDRGTGWRWCLMERCYEADGVDRYEYQAMRASEIVAWAETVGRVDLHGDNYMLTEAADRLVITDPVSATPTGQRAMGWIVCAA